MNNQEFMIEVDKACARSKLTLLKKEKEYSSGRDRLEQFHRAGAAQNILPTEALCGMMAKHFTSIADMCKDPTLYNQRQWREKVGDLRNYTFLLETLLIDIGVK